MTWNTILFDDKGMIKDASATLPSFPAELTAHPETFHSIGLVWDVGSDDTNHNATITVKYRKQGDSAWKYALNLIRIDYDNFLRNSTPTTQNNFAGSICYLTPGATYEIRCRWYDPDATDAEHNNEYQTTVATRAIPVYPTGTVHWVDSTATGSNDGTSKANAFTTIAAAESAASAGDIIRIADGGEYSKVSLSKSGTAGNYIAYEAESLQGATLNGATITGCDYLWFRGFKWKWPQRSVAPNSNKYGIDSTDSTDIVITDNKFGDTSRLAIANGTAATRSGNVFTLDGSPDISGIVTEDKPDLIQITGETSGRGTNGDYFQIDAFDNGAKTVTVSPTPTGGTSGLTWAITGGTNFPVGIWGRNSNVIRWTVMDNDFTGNHPVGVGLNGTPGSSANKGVDLGGEDATGTTNLGYGHVVAYNIIRQMSDGGGVGLRECDVYANKIYDNNDDPWSSDSCQHNVRFWGNQFYQSRGYNISMQPTSGAPWYWMYNQIEAIESATGFWKNRLRPDRMVLVGNSIRASNSTTYHFPLRHYTRNNLWNMGGSFTWYGRYSDASERPAQWLGDWKTDQDHDGYDRNGISMARWFDDPAGDPAPEPLEDFTTLAAFANVSTGLPSKTGWAAVNFHANSIEWVAEDSYTNFTGNEDGSVIWTLDPSDVSADSVLGKGEAINNLADFHGGAPDLGCQQAGETIPIGVRTSEQSSALASRTYFWTKH